MMIPGPRLNFLRDRGGHDGHRVSFSELFFDLVFVFAITQLSHTLLAHFTPMGAAQVAVMFMAVWWVWVFTTWVLNWMDPRHTPVRLMLYAMMLAGLFLSTSIPDAFGDRSFGFAAAYVAMQVGRTLFCCWATRAHHRGNYLNFLRILAWMGVSGVFWIAGAAFGEYRLLLWIAALAIEYAGPAMYFAVPGLGRSTIADWNISGEHLAERCGLFIIVALGESILVSGTTFAHLPFTALNAAGFVVAFTGTVAMWWIYFNIGAERAAHVIAGAADPGRLARLAYTYIHIILVAGIILTAVGDEIILAHPLGHGDLKAAIGICGGPLLFLVGNLIFKRAVFGHIVASHVGGAAALAVLLAAGPFVPPLWLGAAAALVLVVTAAWETRVCGAEKALPHN